MKIVIKSQNEIRTMSLIDHYLQYYFHH